MGLNKTVQELWETISYKLHYIKTDIRVFFERVAGTLAYAKFIWNSSSYREWDYAYLYNLIEFKLKRMEKQLRSDDFVAGSDQTADNIQKALDLLKVYNTIEDGDYDHNNGDIIRDMYAQQQEAWVKLHDLLKEEAQKWWS